MNSMKLSNRMSTMFMNYRNSETSDPHRLLLNLSDKIDLQRSDKYITLSNPSIYYTKNIKKCHTTIINLKCQLRHGIKSMNYLMGHIMYQIFEITFNVFKKKTWRKD